MYVVILTLTELHTKIHVNVRALIKSTVQPTAGYIDANEPTKITVFRSGCEERMSNNLAKILSMCMYELFKPRNYIP